MSNLTRAVTGFSRVLDQIAGFCMVGMMGLIVVNILLRAFFKRPILGTIECVVFLAVAMISLALAYCAVQNGHIAVDFVFCRLPQKMQALIGNAVDAVALIFWGACAWQVGKYAQSMAASGAVSSTVQIPLYPFIYIVAFSLAALSLVLLMSIAESVRKEFSHRSITFLEPKINVMETVQKAAGK